VLSQRRDESHKARGKDNSFISKTEAVKGIKNIKPSLPGSSLKKRLLLIFGYGNENY
jgi:hypothetical protein